MKRLLCLISSLDSGGAETFLMKIYRSLDRSNYQMDFCINVDRVCFYTEEVRSLGGKIYYLPSKSSSLKNFCQGLKKIIRDNHYAYVLRVTSNAMGFLDLKIAKKAGAALCSARSSNSSDGGGIKAFLAHQLGKLLYSRYVDVKFAPSDLAAQYTFGSSAYQNGTVTILHNALDLDVYHYSADGRDKIRTEFGIDQHATIVGHIGRFTPQKNHNFILKVFQKFHQVNDSSILMLIGTGVLEDEIRKKAEELELARSVIFTGVRSDIPDILSAMDVFLFPSLYEGMPNTVIEAQAVGLPCVIADTITREADITGLVEYLSLQECAGEWADAVSKAADQIRLDTRQLLIKNHYDISSIVKEFVSLVFGEKGLP